jgi:hypothetical protein
MPLPPPTALNVGRRGASIELSEVCSSVGQLEARAGEGLALAPLTESAVMDLPAGVGEAEGCRHFFTIGGLGSFWRTALATSHCRILPCLDCSLASRQFLFGVPALKGTLSYFAETGYSLQMPEISRFDCPNCRAEYKLVRAEAGPLPDRQIVCRRCDAPLQGREGKFILKYFFVGRPRT